MHASFQTVVNGHTACVQKNVYCTAIAVYVEKNMIVYSHRRVLSGEYVVEVVEKHIFLHGQRRVRRTSRWPQDVLIMKLCGDGRGRCAECSGALQMQGRRKKANRAATMVVAARYCNSR